MDLNEVRAGITSIDIEIVKLLEKRFILASHLGHYKKNHNLPVYDEIRENRVLELCRDALENKEYSKYIDDIYHQIIKASKDIQYNLGW